MPYGLCTLEIAFDFIDHRLLFETSDGRRQSIALEPKSVADFYSEVMQTLRDLKMPVRIWPMPSEVPSPIRFNLDVQHHSYDRVWVERWWHALIQIDAILKEFGEELSGLRLVPGAHGVYDVEVDGTLVFSLDKAMRFPETPELIRKIRAKIGTTKARRRKA